MRIIKYLILEIIILLYIFLWIGFALHTSPQPEILGKYSLKYFSALVMGLVLLYPFIKIYFFLIKDSRWQVKKRKIRFTPWKKISILFICMILLLTISETYLRLNDIQVKSAPYFLSLENFHPSLQGRLTSKNNKQNSDLHINSFGFRGEEINIKKSENTYRIFILGGSTVFNATIAYNETFSKLLENSLQKKYPGKKIEVLNAGMDGYTSQHSLIQYLFSIKDFQPDLVIMWHGINDMYYSCTDNPLTYGNYKSDYSHNFGSVAKVVKSYYAEHTFPISLFLHFVTFDFIQHAFTYNFYSDLKPWYDKSLTPYLVRQKIIKLEPISMQNYPSIVSYQRNLTSFIEATRADNTLLILGNQPYSYSPALDKQLHAQSILPQWFMQKNCAQGNKFPNYQSLIYGINLFNTMTKEVAIKNNVPFLDLDSKMPKTFTYFFDDAHYTPKGNKKMTEVLYEFILKNNFIF